MVNLYLKIVAVGEKLSFARACEVLGVDPVTYEPILVRRTQRPPTSNSGPRDSSEPMAAFQVMPDSDPMAQSDSIPSDGESDSDYRPSNSEDNFMAEAQKNIKRRRRARANDPEFNGLTLVRNRVLESMPREKSTALAPKEISENMVKRLGKNIDGHPIRPKLVTSMLQSWEKRYPKKFVLDDGISTQDRGVYYFDETNGTIHKCWQNHVPNDQ